MFQKNTSSRSYQNNKYWDLPDGWWKIRFKLQRDEGLGHKGINLAQKIELCNVVSKHQYSQSWICKLRYSKPFFCLQVVLTMCSSSKDWCFTRFLSNFFFFFFYYFIAIFPSETHWPHPSTKINLSLKVVNVLNTHPDLKLGWSLHVAKRFWRKLFKCCQK